MRKPNLGIYGALTLVLLLVGCQTQPAPTSSPAALNHRVNIITQTHMQLTSSDFQDNQPIPSKFTCDGAGSRPQLAWAGVPSETKSLSLALFDPDAPGSGFLHWLVVNMPPQDMTLAGDAQIPAPGIELPNSAAQAAYLGPCPPSGTHRYIFTLYALDVDRIAPKNYDDFLSLVKSHAVSEAQLVGTYQRQE